MLYEMCDYYMVSYGLIVATVRMNSVATDCGGYWNKFNR